MALDLDRVAFAQREYRTVVSEDLAIQTKHPLAVEMEYNTLISSAADAQAFGDSLLALRKLDRDTWSLYINKQNYDFDVGVTITLVYPRFGLQAGGNFIVKRIKRDSGLLYDELTLFGPQ